MNTDNPKQVIDALGEIDDSLARAQQRHSELAGLVKAGADALKKRIQAKTAIALERDKTTRKPTDKPLAANAAEAQANKEVYESDAYAEYKIALREFEEFEKNFDYLDTRRSIGQSILKTMRESEFGQSAGQHPSTGKGDGEE